MRNTGLPAPAAVPLVDTKTGLVTPAWHQVLQAIAANLQQYASSPTASTFTLANGTTWTGGNGPPMTIQPPGSIYSQADGGGLLFVSHGSDGPTPSWSQLATVP